MRNGKVPYFIGALALCIAAFAVCVVVPRSVGYGQSSAPDAVSPTINPKLTTLLSNLAQVVPQQSGLAAIAPEASKHAMAVAPLPKSVRDAMHSRMMRADSNGSVQVYIEVNELTDQELAQIESAGITVEVVAKNRKTVQARVPAPLLAAVTDLPFVRFVRLPNYAIVNTGSVDTQGDTILKADQVRSQLHVDGTNVRVGAISDGIKGIFATSCTTCGPTTATISPITSGDLPSSTGTRTSGGTLTASSGGITAKGFAQNGDLEDKSSIPAGCAFAGAGAEGTALMEIIYDLAPNVQLFFSNADTDMEFNEAVDYVASHADVGVDDLSFVGLPYNGTSDVSSNTAAQLNSSTNPIRAYFTSVGNFAGFHYLGLYTDSHVNGSSITGVVNSGDLHLFQAQTNPATTDQLGLGPKPYDLITLPAGGEAAIFLTWDDPFGASSNNYDLYLAQESNGAVVDKSTDAQSGSQDPFEFIDYINNTGAQENFHIIVQNVNNAAAAKNLSIYIFQPECAASGPVLLGTSFADHNYNTISKSVPAESDAGGSPASVIAVGAERASNFTSTDPLGTPIEPFSSNGPTLDGRNKPDITAVDGVSITGAGSFENPFYGTSAAAPHGAGVAALLLQAASCLRSGSTGAISDTTARTTLHNLIVNNTDPIGSPVPNNTYGSGLVDALASAKKTVPTANAGSSKTFSGNVPGGASLTLDGSASADPDGCALMFDWSGDCGSASGAMPTVTCPVGVDTESLMVSNNGVTFSTTSNVQVTVSDFSVAVSPASQTVIAGQAATYTLTITPQVGVFSDAIILGCGASLPSGVSCSFSPASVAPGGSAATSQLTITTTSPASVVPLPHGTLRLWPFGALPALLVALFLALLALAAKHTKAPRLQTYVSLAALAVLAALQISCGGGGTPPPPPPSPAVTLAPASLTFANQMEGTTSTPQAVTVTNSGSAGLNISTIAASGDFTQANNCPSASALAAGANCTVNVKFAPTATGSRTGALSLSDNASHSPQMVTLSGTGTPGPTPAGTYTVTVSGQSGTLTHSASTTLVVQ
jgi:subtilase family protein/ASPM-SPD-2-Hydin domain-containing protein